MVQSLYRFFKDERAIAMTEFAMALPMLMVLFYGTIEVTRYILIVQKVEKLAHSVADMAAQSQTSTVTTLNQVLSAASDIMNPYSMSDNGKIMITSIYRPNGVANASINWRHEGGGTLAESSKLGVVGATPSMPAGFTFDERENVIAGEAFYRFSPLLSSQFFGTTTVYRVAFYKPRLGALITPPT